MGQVKRFVEKMTRGLEEMGEPSWTTQQWFRSAGLTSPPGWNFGLVRTPPTWSLAKGGLLANGPEFSASIEPDASTGHWKLFYWVGAGLEYYESQAIRKTLETALVKMGFRMDSSRNSLQGFKTASVAPPRGNTPEDVAASLAGAAREFDQILTALARLAGPQGEARG